MADINARPQDETVVGRANGTPAMIWQHTEQEKKMALLMTGLADINARPPDEAVAMILQHTEQEKKWR